MVNFIALFFPTIVSPALLTASSLTFGVGSVALGSLLQKEFSQKQRATMGSINSLLGNILFGVSSVLVGVLADRTDARTALIVVNILLLAPLIFYRKIFLPERVNGGRIQIS